MHAMIRTFTGKGAADLAKLLTARKSEIEKLIRDVPGLVSYDLIETADGCQTVTVCKDKAGTDKSLAIARDWLKANAGHLGVSPPAVSEGKVQLYLRADVPAATH